MSRQYTVESTISEQNCGFRLTASNRQIRASNPSDAGYFCQSLRYARSVDKPKSAISGQFWAPSTQQNPQRIGRR